MLQECGRATHASAIILNTFEALENDVLQEISSILPSIGLLTLLLNHKVITKIELREPCEAVDGGAEAERVDQESLRVEETA
ncbi:hypothetical protein VNO78_01347 [Psophocarpus tetragonolobus]|uniref:Uncharacterized protein n=1 Tax=Psophocarpus tetragonolobus TaxID=3891 RepID=A0AAN9SZG7_PSOTE